ncbi:hypothetical protein BJ991_002874 [Microbacterium immunditiarum]|uniref:Lipoprotein n=1 Tax=Microbacterium immunditiarum TaxID=337480 RepID=A0A7Y9GQZ3_9MICO|nr:hypothetical protein [Microbacterium immunditiarum]
MSGLIHRSATIFIGVSLLLAASLAGCASTPPAAEAPPTPDAAAEHTPSEATSPSSEPSDGAGAGIRFDGIGDLSLGGSFADAAATLGTQPDAERCTHMLSTRDAWFTWVLAAFDGSTVTDTIGLIAIDSWAVDPAPAGAPRTAEAIGLGSTLDDVHAAYPGALDEEPKSVDFAVRAVDGDGAIVFEGREGVVRAITVLPAIEPTPWEYCG